MSRTLPLLNRLRPESVSSAMLEPPHSLDRVIGCRWNLAPAVRRHVFLKQLFDFGFVESRELLLTLDDHGPLKEVRIFEHKLDRLVFRRRLLLHVPFAIKRRARVEKFLDRSVADDLAQLVL